MTTTGHLVTRATALRAVAAGVGAGLTMMPTQSASAAEVVTPALNVKSFGARGDGISDDTAAIASAIARASGEEIFFPNGTYVVGTVYIDAVASLSLATGATLLHKPDVGNGAMFIFRGTHFKIRGGCIDGNKSRQSGRPYIIAGRVQDGKRVELDGVHLTNSVAAVIYASSFGGQISVEHCRVTGQAEHSGITGNFTCIVMTVSGQADEQGLLRFNHNVCIGTEAPAIAGGNPGGIFMATNGYVAGSPGSEGFAQGNGSTLEAIGNFFSGYGQHAGGNDISPIHTYPMVNGARVIGNYFERCGFCAISAKSVQNFVCTGNTIVNGLTSTQNVASEGAISYMPGYQSNSMARPRAVISGNIIDSPGGQPGERQSGISVHGLAASHAQNVVVTDNVLSGCGRGIKVNYVDDITISGNVINGSAGDAAYTKDEDGIRVDNAYGHVQVFGNRIYSRHGHGLYAYAGVSTARFSVANNIFEHSSPTHYGTTLRACAYVHLADNQYRSTAGTALYLTGVGTTKIGHVHLGENSFVQGNAVVDYANVVKATGKLHGNVDPRGRVTPGEVGTVYRRTSGREPDALWVATGLTSTDWAPLMTGGADSKVPAVRLAAGAGSSASARVLGNDAEGVLEISTGAAPVSDAQIASVVFASPRPTPPKAVLLSPANVEAARQTTKVIAPLASLAASGFSVTAVGGGLKAGSAMQWYYRVL